MPQAFYQSVKLLALLHLCLFGVHCMLTSRSLPMIHVLELAKLGIKSRENCRAVRGLLLRLG